MKFIKNINQYERTIIINWGFVKVLSPNKEHLRRLPLISTSKILK